MKYSLGPDKINSSLGQISSFSALFFPVQLFVLNAATDLCLEEGRYAKQYKLHLLTNIQNPIELSFILWWCQPQLSKALLLMCCFLKSGTPFFQNTHLSVSFQSLHPSLRSVYLNDPFDELCKLVHAPHLPEIEVFFPVGNQSQ